MTLFDKGKSNAHFSLQQQGGFTLIELMIVVAIIGILASAGMSSYRNMVVRAELTKTANDLGQFAREFKIWKQVNGEFPNDSHVILPEDAGGLAINTAVWLAPTGIGGNYNWEGPDNYSYAGISIVGATAEDRDIEQLDAILDNGDLSSGHFRKTSNGRFTFILEE